MSFVSSTLPNTTATAVSALFPSPPPRSSLLHPSSHDSDYSDDDDNGSIHSSSKLDRHNNSNDDDDDDDDSDSEIPLEVRPKLKQSFFNSIHDQIRGNEEEEGLSRNGGRGRSRRRSRRSSIPHSIPHAGYDNSTEDISDPLAFLSHLHSKPSSLFNFSEKSSLSGSSSPAISSSSPNPGHTPKPCHSPRQKNQSCTNLTLKLNTHHRINKHSSSTPSHNHPDIDDLVSKLEHTLPNNNFRSQSNSGVSTPRNPHHPSSHNYYEGLSHCYSSNMMHSQLSKQQLQLLQLQLIRNQQAQQQQQQLQQQLQMNYIHSKTTPKNSHLHLNRLLNQYTSNSLSSSPPNSKVNTSTPALSLTSDSSESSSSPSPQSPVTCTTPIPLSSSPQFQTSSSAPSSSSPAFDLERKRNNNLTHLSLLQEAANRAQLGVMVRDLEYLEMM